MSFDDLVPTIPLDEASDYFLKLKYGSSRIVPTEEQVVEMFAGLSKEAQEEILIETGLLKRASDELPLDQYMAQEQEGMAAQKEVEQQYLGQRMQDMQAQLQMAQQGSEASGAQMQQLQQQLAQSNQQIQVAQQQAAQAQQSAMQAQQTQLQSADEALRTQQMAAQMRTAYQQLRGQLMELATVDPAQSVGNEMKGQPAEMGPEGMAPPGPPGMSPDPGADPTAGGPPPEQGAAPAPPGPDAQVTPKVASPAFGALGGIGGGAAGMLLANREVESGPERHKAQLSELRAAPENGFVNALQQARAKAMLAFSEAARSHPNAARAAGAALGVGTGVGLGDSLKGLMTTTKY